MRFQPHPPTESLGAIAVVLAAASWLALVAMRSLPEFERISSAYWAGIAGVLIAMPAYMFVSYRDADQVLAHTLSSPSGSYAVSLLGTAVAVCLAQSVRSALLGWLSKPTTTTLSQ